MLYHSIFLDAVVSQDIILVLIFLSLFLFFFTSHYGRILALVIICFLLGFLRFHVSIDTTQKHALDYFAQEKQEVKLQGKISKKPEQQEGVQQIVFDIDGIILGEDKQLLSSTMLLKTRSLHDFSYGDLVEVTVIPKAPDIFTGEDGRTFDYEHFLEKDGIYYTGKTDTIHLVKKAPFSFINSLYFLKKNFIKKIYQHIPNPESALLVGVLLGEKTALGDKLEDDFRTTGLMHIVVLSGYNVSLVIFAVMFLLKFLPLYTRSVLAVVGIIIFALLVGAGPTVIRASLMALFIVLAKVLGRPYHVEKALIIAGLSMVIYNPWILYYDISFQFSFLATYGLIALSPHLSVLFAKIPEVFMLRESAVATTAAQIMVAPLILYYIGDFSLISILVNMLVLFMVPISMLLGFFVTIFSFFSYDLATLFSIPTTLSLKYILWVVDLFARVPFSKFTVKSFSFVWVIGWYILVYFLYLYFSQKEKKFD